MSFHSHQSFSVSFCHVSLGLPGPRLPSICISHAFLTAPLERSTCPNQRSVFSLRMRSRSSSSSFTSSSLDLTVPTFSGLILQICLILSCGLRQVSLYIMNARLSSICHRFCCCSTHKFDGIIIGEIKFLLMRYSKTCVKHPLRNRLKKYLNDKW